MIGERVRLAREACRLTQKSLAASSGVSLGTLSSIENGLILEPSIETVERIASATGFPLGFFYQGQLPDMPEGNFRRKKRVPAKDIKQIRAYARQVVELVQRSEGSLRLPRATLEPVSNTLDGDQIEELATETRRRLGVGIEDPIPNFTRALERAGVVVAQLPYVPGNVSYSVWPDYALGGRPIVARVGSQPGDRNRANLGHELGHLMLHAEMLNIEYEQAEKEAWRFGGAILLPMAAAKEAMRRHLTMRVLMGIKARYGVSMHLAIRRAYDLKIISDEHYHSLNKQLSARGWRIDEPVVVRNEDTLLIRKIIGYMSGEGSAKEKAVELNIQDAVLRSLIAPPTEIAKLTNGTDNVLTFRPSGKFKEQRDRYA
jgi:Zn-dependent peptidase ImmA (M78 family)/DNA-binding XRE family transcriptional regulator